MSSQESSHDVSRCLRCGATSFRDADELRAHIVVVHECPVCGMLCETDDEIDPHLAIFHGKYRASFVPYDGYGRNIVPEHHLLDIDRWQPPALSTPSTEKLRALCLRMTESDLPELGLENVPAELTDTAVYVEANFAIVRKSEQAAQYRRRRPEGRADFLVTALLNPNITPTSAYAKHRSRPK